MLPADGEGEADAAPALPSLHFEAEGGADLPTGARLGRYVVISRIGRGGSGIVYSAFDPELDRKVAVKLLRAIGERSREASREGARAASGEGRQARLLREAQAMARLTHPNVVAVYDVGTYQDGVFLAMEFVEGGTLRDWLRQRLRTWRESLDLVVAAGHGLAAAHAAGLVHRDFKPENVLVGNDGRPRVTDFGLVRAAGESTPPRSVPPVPPADPPRTEAGAPHHHAPSGETSSMAGTPGYMAPEQYLGDEIDERTDQFNFAATVYEMIYGEVPFVGRGIEAIRKSTLAGSVRLPARGSSVPAWVRRALVRALSPERADRHPSMDALLEALARDPATARRRTTALVALALAIGGACFAAIHVSSPQLLVCAGASQNLAGVWDREMRASVAHAFAASRRPYAVRTLESVEASLDRYARGWAEMRTTACEATRVRGEQTEQVLDLRMMCLDERLHELQSLTRALAVADDGAVQHAAEAAASLSRLDSCANVASLGARVPPLADPATRNRVEALRSANAEVRGLYLAGGYKEGVPLAAGVVSRARAMGYAPILGEALELLGEMQVAAGDAPAAEATFRQTVLVADEGKDDAMRLIATSKLAGVLGYWELRMREAREVAAEAHAILRRIGPEDALEADLLQADSDISWQAGLYAEYVTTTTRLLTLRERVQGPSHPLTGRAHIALGVGIANDADFDRALAEEREGVSILAAALGPEHPDLSDPLNDLGRTLSLAGRHDEAIETLKRAIAIAEQGLGPDHPSIAISTTNLGRVLRRIGRCGEARPLFDRSVRIYEARFSPQYEGLLYPLIEVGLCEIDLGHPNDAIAPLERALRLEDGSPGIQPDKIAETRFALARALWSANRDANLDKPRARSLAADARDGYAKVHTALARGALAEVSEWIRRAE